VGTGVPGHWSCTVQPLGASGAGLGGQGSGTFLARVQAPSASESGRCASSSLCHINAPHPRRCPSKAKRPNSGLDRHLVAFSAASSHAVIDQSGSWSPGLLRVHPESLTELWRAAITLKSPLRRRVPGCGPLCSEQRSQELAVVGSCRTAAYRWQATSAAGMRVMARSGRGSTPPPPLRRNATCLAMRRRTCTTAWRAE
jgi:hypothetical protein